MQQDLQELEQRWSLAERSAGFGVWDLDVLNEQVVYSPQWKARLGYAETEGPDSTTTWRGRVHPEDLQPMLTALTGHLVGRRPAYEHEFRLRAADGEYRWVLSRGRVVERDAAGAALRAVGTLVDLTERREVEGLLAERDAARAARRLRMDFLGRMSHELRTPLNAVLGFTQLLSRLVGQADAEEQRRYLELVERSGWRLLEMIDDVLDLRHVDHKRLELCSEPVVLAPLVDQVMTSMTPLARSHAVRLLPPGVPAEAAVRADPARLQQVLERLVGHSVRHTQRDGSVHVAAASAGAAWRLSVADTGPGLPSDELARLLEPFGPGEAVRGTGAFGIGLVLSQSLVELMGGELAVQSAEQAGTIFEVTLPAAAA